MKRKEAQFNYLHFSAFSLFSTFNFISHIMSTDLTDSTLTVNKYYLPTEMTAYPLCPGDRVQINSLQGTVRFVGSTKFKPGIWAGVELDRVGAGKNDGSVNG